MYLYSSEGVVTVKNLNFVPKPWTPIEVEENHNGITVKIWGREYYFGNEIFPKSIKAMGQELLSSPIHLTGESNDEEIKWINKENWVQEQDNRKVVICAAAESRLIVLSATITIEFDGYINFAFNVVPTGLHPRAGFDVKPDRAKRIINKLWLEIPLKSEVGKLCHYGSWDKGVYSGFATEGFITFRPQNWYGNDEVGLGIYFDSDKNWQSIDRNSACETFKNENSYVIRYRLLDSAPAQWEREERQIYTDGDISKKAPTGIERTPLSYGISLQATPIKPYDQSLLKEHIIHIDCFDKIDREYTEFLMSCVSEDDNTCVLDQLKNKGVTTIALHQAWNRIQGYWRLGKHDSQRIHLLIKEIHKRGMKVLFYFCNGISTLRPVDDDYIKKNMRFKFNQQPDIGFYRAPPQRVIRCCAKGPDIFEDLTKGMSYFLSEYNADGVYIDSADIPWDCTNTAHGCGYIDEFGIVHATYPMNAMRKAFQGIYEEIHDKLGKTIQLHPANAFVPAFHAYSDLVWNGEQVAFRFKTNTKALLNAFDDGFMRTELTGRNIGVPFQFLAYDLPDNSWNIKMALSFVAPYGTYPRPINIHKHLDEMSPIWKALDHFKAYDCEFKGFYQGNVGATCNNSAVKISSYTGSTTFVLLVANPTDTEFKDVEITSDFPANLEIISGKNLSGRQFKIDIKPFETIFIECKK